MGADLTPVSYIAGTAASITAVLAGARSYYARQRKRWTDEGARAEASTQALEANTRAAAANTAALADLGRKLGEFTDETRRELNGHDQRIGRLEDVAERPMHVRRPEGRAP
jgi:hypothetical protein